MNDDSVLSNSTPKGRGWYQRGYLPHFDDSDVLQFITWRLADSLPRVILERFEQELVGMSLPDAEREAQRRHRIEELLDRGFGNCWLRRKSCATILRDILLEGCGHLYHLHAWVIMPNHVHLLVEFTGARSMGDIVEAWKSASAHGINTEMRRTGAVWQDDFWDRYIRNREHYENTRRYIELNPVKANLVKSASAWPWSSARR